MENPGLQGIAIESLFNSGLLGLGWADSQQILRAKRGRLVKNFVVDQPLCNQSPALFGMAEVIQALQKGEPKLTVPRVGEVAYVCDQQKITIEIIWDRELEGYIILLHADGSVHNEQVLTRKHRLRRMAEETLYADLTSSVCSSAIVAELTKLIAEMNGRQHASELQKDRNPLEKLTEREKEVVKLLIKGNSNKIIGHTLNISEKTVEVHRARAIKRLGVRTSAELIRMAGKYGLE